MNRKKIEDFDIAALLAIGIDCLAETYYLVQVQDLL